MRHEFRERLDYSLDPSDEPFWIEVYQTAFTVLDQHPITDLAEQKRGRDRAIHLINGEVVYVDEKKRPGVYADFLLEFIANDTTNAPGWINKDLHIHYIAYAFMPINTVYLLDWLMLKRSWLIWGEAWLRRYPHIAGENAGYTTWSVAVPITEVHNAIRVASIIKIQR